MKNRIEIIEPLAAGRKPAQLAETNRRRVALQDKESALPRDLKYGARVCEIAQLKSAARAKDAELAKLRAQLDQNSAEAAAHLRGADLAAFYEKSGPTVRETLRKTRYADLIAATSYAPKKIIAWNKQK
jgi:hypothetical protein